MPRLPDRRSGWLRTLALTAALSACSDATPPTSPVTAPDATPVALSREQALDQLAHAFALALRDDAVRARVKTDLRASRFTREHKLELARYLQGSGGFLLRAMEAAVGRSDGFGMALRAGGPLEFYLPVRSQRERWTGGEDLMVAYALEEGSPPIGFTLDGTRVALSASTPPDVPVLSLVPVETDFSRPLPVDWVNTNDQNGASIGTLRRPRGGLISPSHGDGGGDDGGDDGGGDDGECDPVYEDYCDPPPTPAENPYAIPPYAPTGLYMNWSHIDGDMGEDWSKGEPEIEIIVLGPRPTDSPDLGRHIGCAGEETHMYYDWMGGYQSQAGWRAFNQDNNEWWGEALLLTAEQISSHRFDEALPDPRKMEIMVLEDDNWRCRIVMEQNYYRARARALVDNAISLALFVGCLLDESTRRASGFDCVAAALYTFIEGIEAIYDAITTQDEFLGFAIKREQTSLSAEGVATHVIAFSPTSRSGALRLTYHTRTQ